MASAETESVYCNSLKRLKPQMSPPTDPLVVSSTIWGLNSVADADRNFEVSQDELAEYLKPLNALQFNTSLDT